MNKTKHIFIEPEFWFYQIVKWTGAPFCLLDLRLRKIYESGKKPKKYYQGKYLISANHMSFEDPVILEAVFWMRRLKFIATSDFFNTKAKAWLFKHFGCIPINKQNPSMETFSEVKRTLDRGHAVAIFPEGHVSETNDINQFKSGIIMMAVMNDCDIVPVYMAKRTNRIHRQTVVMGNHINIHDYIKGPFPSMEEVNNLAQILQQKEIELEQIYLTKYKRGNK